MPLPRKSKGRNAKVPFWILFPNSPNITDVNVHQNMHNILLYMRHIRQEPSKRTQKINNNCNIVACVVNSSC